MKIGILTVPFNNNYGGFLQAFALKHILVNKGHEVLFINRRRNRPNRLKDVVYRLFVRWHLIKDKVAIMTANISVNTNSFKNKYLTPITKEYYTASQLRKSLKLRLDCVIVGSDQVWRYKYAGDSIDDYFCNFLENKNISHFSYAASMGVDAMEYPDDKLNICKRLLGSFSAISVREKSAADLLERFFGQENVTVVLDPTLLVDKSVYINLFKDNYPTPKEPYILTYILDDDSALNQEIEKIANKHNSCIVNLKAQTGDFNTVGVLRPVEEWLASIYYSDYIITDSYHGTVFSIIFHKPFTVFSNAERGTARLTDLLTRLGAMGRIVSNACEISDVMNEPIDWDNIDKNLNLHRVNSMNFLNTCLDNAKNENTHSL